MKNRIISFVEDSDGAITVDWAVVSALVIALGFTSVAVVLNGNSALGGKVSSNMSEAEIHDLKLD